MLISGIRCKLFKQSVVFYISFWRFLGKGNETEKKYDKIYLTTIYRHISLFKNKFYESKFKYPQSGQFGNV